jgi:hypothetical protein
MTMTKQRTIVGGFAIACALAWPAISAAQLPNHERTPGSATKVDAKLLCSEQFSATVKPLTAWQKEEALTRYGIRPEAFDGTLEHLVPVSLGGTNSPDNLFPFHAQGDFTLEAKTQLAEKLRQLVCDGSVSLKAAQDLFKKDWTKAYRQYMQPLNASGN